MLQNGLSSIFVFFALSTLGFAQPDAAVPSIGPADAYQIRYAANLSVGDSVINMTNTGASGANLCVNLYTFDPGEELVSCCSCTITPNALQSISVLRSLISNTLTRAVPTSVVVKMIASTSSQTSTCNAADIDPATLAPGLRAWGTTLHQAPTLVQSYVVTEAPFLNTSLTPGELNHVTSFCGFIQAIGGGYGICRGCAFNGLSSTAVTN